MLLCTGSAVELDCQVGQYCPEGVGGVDCPVLHYRDIVRGENEDDCFGCVAGYWCNTTGK